MSERKLRTQAENIFGSFIESGVVGPFEEVRVYRKEFEKIGETLAEPPDVVKVLLYAKEELEKCEEVIAEADKPGPHILAWVQEAAVWTVLIAWIGDEFHVRLTDKGWEWMEEATDE